MTHDRGENPSSEDGPRARPGPEDPDTGRRWDDADVDTAFAAIVAQFSERDSPVGPWSAAEDVSEDDMTTEPSADTATGQVAPGSGESGDRTLSRADMVDDLPEDPGTADGDTFTPPDPPLPSGDLIGRLAWLGVIAGPLILVIAVMVGWPMTTLFLALTLGPLVAGFITLVARLPSNRPDDGDDGAVL